MTTMILQTGTATASSAAVGSNGAVRIEREPQVGVLRGLDKFRIWKSESLTFLSPLKRENGVSASLLANGSDPVYTRYVINIILSFIYFAEDFTFLQIYLFFYFFIDVARVNEPFK